MRLKKKKIDLLFYNNSLRFIVLYYNFLEKEPIIFG